MRVTVRVPETVSIWQAMGPNWVLISSRASVIAGSPGLIHRDPTGEEAVAFRGYLLEPAVHGYSSTREVLDIRWAAEGRMNGVFAVAQVGASRLVLVTDALGLSPLYYRMYGDGVAFSTSVRYLKCVGDRPDLVGWSQILQAGYMASDRALVEAVKRVPAGCRVIADRGGVRESAWFELGSLPDGRRPVDEAALREVEGAFQTAVDRSLALAKRDVVLPLSSGHDSRRILAALRSRRIRFEALTVRVFQKQHRDLDARYAAMMAADMKFAHRVIEPARGRPFSRDDQRRCALVDGETTLHTWALRLLDALPRSACLVLDGLMGDVLANPGYRIPGLYRSHEQDLELIVQECLPDNLEKICQQGVWPKMEEVREDFRAYLRAIGPRRNLAELAFVLLRTRRMMAPWLLQMLPAGHLAVCPYADLDYVRLLLSLDPQIKGQRVVQRLCLEMFWPEYAAYPGNRDIPENLPPGSGKWQSRENRVRMRRLLGGVLRTGRIRTVGQLLTRRAAARVWLSGLNGWVRDRSVWFAIPLLEMIDRIHPERAAWYPANPRSCGPGLAASAGRESTG